MPHNPQPPTQDITADPTEEAVSATTDSILAVNPKLDREAISKTLLFVWTAHKGQIRKSGEPYIIHPIAVAKMLAELQMDSSVVLAGLLHDVVEDTKHSKQEIAELFGNDVAEMVDAVTKIENIQKGSDRTAKTFQKFLTSISKHPQVIVIKLSDRLHNMRTIKYMKPDRREAIAKETLDFYAPLAHRLGLYSFKFELEDLAFKELHPQEYSEVENHLKQTIAEREEYINSIIFPLQIKMNLEQLECDIRGRSKHIYSIWEKMKNRNCKIDELYDIFAIRIIVEQIPDCYTVLGNVHNLYPPLSSRFKDYIATPKQNLYQSLHTVVVGPRGTLVEVQIRTRDMDEIAEHGLAAHWAYKFNSRKEDYENNLDWIDKITKMQNEIPESVEFLEFLYKNMTPDDCYAFTPNGRKITLQFGATILDFAFAVHTELGLRCAGARASDKILAIDSPVPIGETIQILKSDTQEPQENWLAMVKTPKAQLEIRRWLKKSVEDQAILLGKKIYLQELQKFKIPLENAPQDVFVCRNFSTMNVERFYRNLGKGEISLTDIADFLKPYSGDNTVWHRGLFNVFRSGDASSTDTPITIGYNERFLLDFANCCNPVPGDNIKGIFIAGKGIQIHKADCSELAKYPREQRLTIQWESNDIKSSIKFVLKINSVDRIGIAGEIFNCISEHNASIKKSVLESKGSELNCRIEIIAFRSAQIKNIIQSLNSLAGVRKVIRA
ncbi:GTP pyrophosphokinase [Fibrobacterales bacterium]|nr:GTP pyrophosphokinase [Fibrobacterales bacterium]